MMTLYWPRKKVPEWLQRFEFSGTSDGVPAAYHNGFGVIVKVHGKFFVWMLAGEYLRVKCAGMAVHIKGQGRGVVVAMSLGFFVEEIKRELDRPHPDSAG